VHVRENQTLAHPTCSVPEEQGAHQ
jgi:hypothetical protein